MHQQSLSRRCAKQTSPDAIIYNLLHGCGRWNDQILEVSRLKLDRAPFYT
jgi:hypothetical protein